ncbi:hypothetical protein CPB86DRAFT_820087 [Serendipita vermifera]|nr:hypothetical protein CPB86DRAFT_820087 [Serendipita vermifera]
MGIFIDSWLFVFSGGIVVSGIGMSLNIEACLSGIYLCIVFYATSKILIYIFLADKVYIVWSANNPVSRMQSRIWILCGIVLLGYIAIFILMLVARIGYIRADGTCVIGLEGMASIPLLAYDCFLNVFLTTLFVWPLLRRKLSNPKLHALAKRTCYAATVALGTSVVNILILTLLHGRQLGWVCLGSCGFDVTVNAMVIFAISRKSQSTGHSRPHTTVKEQAASVTVDGSSPPQDESGRGESSGHVKHQEMFHVPKALLPPFKKLAPSHLPSFAHRNGGRHNLPDHQRRQPSSYGAQTETNLESLSKIGDFAVTRDEAGVLTMRGSVMFSDDHDRKGNLDNKGQEKGSTLIRMTSLTSSPSSAQDSEYTLGRKDSSKSGFGLRPKTPDQGGVRYADGTQPNVPSRTRSRSVMQVIPVLHEAQSSRSSTSNEFGDGLKDIAFRGPRDSEDGRMSEDLPAPVQRQLQQRLDETNNSRKSGVIPPDATEEIASFAITDDGHVQHSALRGYGLTKGHR